MPFTKGQSDDLADLRDRSYEWGKVDGGRLQTRSEGPGQGPGIHEPTWREDKVTNLLTLDTQSHDQDPHPELPRCFTKSARSSNWSKGSPGKGRWPMWSRQPSTNLRR